MVVVAVAIYVSALYTDAPVTVQSVPTQAGVPPDAPDTTIQIPTAAEPAVEAAAAPEQDLPPRVDVVRVDPDGNTVIAGTATPGSQVVILLDDAELDAVQAGADGGFVSLLTLPLAGAPRVLSLLSNGNGDPVASDEQIILAPSATATVTDTAPVATPVGETVLAAREPAAAPETPPQGVDIPEPDGVVSPEFDTPVTDAEPEVTPTDTADVPQLAERPEQSPVQIGPVPSEKVAEMEQSQSGIAPVAVAITAPSKAGEPLLAENDVAGFDAVSISVAPSGQSDKPGDTQIVAPEAPIPHGMSAGKPPVSTGTPASVAVLRSGSDGIELLQPTVPDDPLAAGGFELDTISYSKEGDVLLRGRAAGGAVVRVYLDNTAAADIESDDDGRWRGAIKDVVPGVYTLRLDELGPDGKVTNRLETPFQRASPEALNPTAGSDLDSTPLIRGVTVQAGDTLWAISRERYGDGVLYVRVFEANRDSIKNPDLIYPGQVFTIPE
jgi:nucleoid-associated protein YgaU